MRQFEISPDSFLTKNSTFDIPQFIKKHPDKIITTNKTVYKKGSSMLNTKKFKTCHIEDCPIKSIAAAEQVSTKTLTFADFKKDIVKKPNLVQNWESPESNVYPVVGDDNIINWPHM